MNLPKRITTQVRRLSPVILDECRRVQEEAKKRKAADLAHDASTEARARTPRRTSFHDL
jgi:hypothetical protein